MKLDGINGIAIVTCNKLSAVLEQVIEQAVQDNPEASTNDIVRRVQSGIALMRNLSAPNIWAYTEDHKANQLNAKRLPKEQQ